ncbi:tRNA (guanosine(46)-N7)-methyltransferase TrmB [Streptococcus hongkongensis]|nr:tRNA (guanine-N7)-methyltransferase [Streptococcus uberis]
MRVRKRKGAEEHLENYPNYVLLTPEESKGRWKEVFGNDNPIHVEVGSGKGGFVTGMAQQNPDINYIGIDIQLSVLSYALDKVIESGVSNVKLLRVDGSSLTNYFENGEIDLLYLNFSDPWPKTKHEKRRLTYKEFLATYKEILPENGQIHFKTDNRGLFEYSLASMSQFGMTLNQVWLDLHASDYQGNVMTEYEAKFSSKGQVIYRLEAQF